MLTMVEGPSCIKTDVESKQGQALRKRQKASRDRRYKLWWSGNNDVIGGVETFVKEELCEKVVEVRRKSDRMMVMVLVFEKQVIGVICAQASQVGRSECEKDQFYNDMANDGIFKTQVK